MQFMNHGIDNLTLPADQFKKPKTWADLPPTIITPKELHKAHQLLEQFPNHIIFQKMDGECNVLLINAFPLSEYHYSYSLNGNIVKIVHKTKKITYMYNIHDFIVVINEEN